MSTEDFGGGAVILQANLTAGQSIPSIIYGSCVTRDMFEIAAPQQLKVVDYIARQSWCSIGCPASPPEFKSIGLESPFQTRSFRGDLRGDALQRIATTLEKQSEANLLLDLTDERGGIYVAPDGSVITRNLDLPNSEVYAQLSDSWDYLPFGFLGYSLLFGEAASKLKDDLVRLGVWERTTIIGNLWAHQDAEGQQVYASERDAEAMNPLLSECYDFLEDQGWQVVRMEDVTPIADVNHKWGPSPFHYDQSYYQEMARRVGETLAPRVQSRHATVVHHPA